jgi:hypothetical protein
MNDIREREPHRRFARRHGVTPKTIDRWVEREILPKPEYINGRKYWPVDTKPRRDDEPEVA